MTTSIQGRTKLQIRRAIGFALLGPRLIVSTMTATGSTTTAADATLTGGDTDYIGSWFIPDTGTAAGEIVRVTAFDETGGASAGLLTFNALSNADSVDSGDTYEMWPDEVPPIYIDNLIEQAIIDATGITYDPEEDITVHLHPDEVRYDVPTQFAMVNKLEVRTRFNEVILETCDTVWGTLHANVTGSADTQIQRRGNASLKLVTGSQADGDNLAEQTIGAVDISGFTHLEFWIRSITTKAAADVQIVLSDSSGEEERLSIAAVSAADTWEFQRIALASPEDDTAIITIEVESNHATNMDSATIWFDDFKVTKADDWRWVRINPRDWYLDRQARDIMFRNKPNYALLKITGGDKPAIPSSDTEAMEIDDSYVIQYVTAMERMRTARDGPERNLWAARAEQAKAGLRKFSNIRRLG